MKKGTKEEITVGFFILAGLGLLLSSILILGGNESIFSKKLHFFSYFKSVEGLVTGSKTVIGGVTVGTVESIAFDTTHQAVKVNFSVQPSAANWVKTDSVVEINTQGVLGDKFLAILTGSPEATPLKPGSEIPQQASRDITQFLNKGDQLLAILTRLATNLDHVVKSFEQDQRSEIFFKNLVFASKNFAQLGSTLDKKVNNLRLEKITDGIAEIVEKVNNGTGTLGALINDSSLFDEFRALVGGINRNRIIKNLVRQTIKDSEKKKNH